ncbi:glycosyltransferase family 4 protein [Algibacter amylolyticus]|uniref:Glycosyltransferase family 4 protein n=1 Tax=Algibacter amylolyticus TaxID=1608400 RepID=A0A5M7BEP6_9FLAO|nr:glycosyltransferase family 4 protein [Algibacter amylolyticus]KAA5827410.1 glycosyltransferase family 4 protein [Algibacter amylolyticus]MBB5266602.1 glycosyltransferase involved in cell wall biosynthesis [Algibacter amylolyticus]TSJ81655.1 glycosyltransferase family 4 protein [Algibacter amylolyticus]
MKDLLIITNYFPPETGAASNRIFHLSEGLQKHNFNVSVLTPLPNYPKGRVFKDYRGRFKQTSVENDITIHRLWIYASNSKNKLLRLIAMLSYSFSLIWFFMWNKIPETVVIQSPPLLVAFTSVLFLRSKKRKLILNVSDLWPLAGLELGALKKNFSYRILEKIERFNYKHADLILGQSDEILTHVKSLYSKKEIFLYRNYPDFKAQAPNQEIQTSEKLKIVYAGLLGIAQGILKLCEHLDYSKIQLHIYGAGAEQLAIQYLIKNKPELDIIYHGEVSRQELHSVLTQYDITIIPLLNRIYGSVPSKIFEYARLGMPMLYFGGGEGETVINKYELGWVANAGDYAELNTVISNLDRSKLSLKNRIKIQNIAFTNFDFNIQLKQLIEVI